MKTTAYLGLPIWKRLYGFGDSLTIRARMINTFVGGIDRGEVARALPTHPLVRLHPRAPLLLVQTDFLSLRDDADPDHNDFPAHEVMVAVILEPTVGRVPVLFPLILFVDEPVSIAAGRDSWVPEGDGRDRLARRRRSGRLHPLPRSKADVGVLLLYPLGGEDRDRARERGAIVSGLRALARAVAPFGLAAGARSLEQLALGAAGEVWNIRQLPDLSNPRRAALSQLTRFKPTLTDPSGFRALRGVTADFAKDGPWPLARFCGAEGPRVFGGFEWEATMSIAGGDVSDSW